MSRIATSKAARRAHANRLHRKPAPRRDRSVDTSLAASAHAVATAWETMYRAVQRLASYADDCESMCTVTTRELRMVDKQLDLVRRGLASFTAARRIVGGGNV